MPYFTKYHVREQSARALLQPVHATLRDLESRTAHYVARLHLEDGAGQALEEAHAALRGARERVERLIERGETGESATSGASRKEGRRG